MQMELALSVLSGILAASVALCFYEKVMGIGWPGFTGISLIFDLCNPIVCLSLNTCQ